jgi:hypothetical protein
MSEDEVCPIRDELLGELYRADENGVFAGYQGAPCPLLLSPQSSAHEGGGHRRKL